MVLLEEVPYLNAVEITTYCLGALLLVGFGWWYYKTGYNYTNRGISIVKRFFQWIVWEFDNPMARQVVLYLREICKSVPLTYFMLGAAFEALGLGIQGMFGMDTYPLLDFLIAGVAATALYVYQNRKVKNVQLT
jgi:hypothetical protein